jgi:uncharacterized spore protein YtfJ
MSVPDILRTIGETFQSSATVKNVYGEPISVGDRTVIPVARISYGFGGGGGARQGEEAPPQRGGGGGGHMCAAPVGVFEITSAGSQFIPFPDWRRLGALVAISFAVGLLIGRRRGE